MHTIKNSILFVVLLLASSIVYQGCVKGDFDVPENDFPNITADQVISMDELFASSLKSSVTPLTIEKYLEVVVVADDKSGNFYKTIIVEDINSDKGLSVSIDENEIHGLFPVGKKVYILLKDLALGYFEGLPTLGVVEGTKVGRMPAVFLKTNFFRGGNVDNLEPVKVTLAQLGPDYYNRYVEIDGMQFQTATPSTTYADANPIDPQSVNHTIVDCDKNELVLRNSGFADFASYVVPRGNGPVRGIYSYYRNAAQFFIRDTTDIRFYGDRCGQVGAGNRISIQSVRDSFAMGKTTIKSGFIQGIVISDFSTASVDTRNVYVQDGNAGIVLRFEQAPNIALGTEVKVVISSVPLSEFNGLLQVATLPVSNAEPIGTGSVTPKVVKVSEINLSTMEGTLIQIKDAEISGGATYGASGISVSDGTGSITLFTRNQATFASQPVKSGKVTITAMVSEFNTPQLIIRKLEDVEGGTIVDPNPTDGIDEKFSSQTNNQDINIPGWDNIAVKGTRKWQGKLFSGNLYAQATAFNDAAPEMETWLVTPEIDTDKTGTLTFESAKAFLVHDGLSAWVSTNYSGNPATATWVKIDTGIAKASDADNTFVPSGSTNLKTYGAKVRIGFKYEGTGGTNTSTFRLDNILVK